MLRKLLAEHPWYAQHIYAAMKKYCESGVYLDRSPAQLQCELLRDAALHDAELWYG